MLPPRLLPSEIAQMYLVSIGVRLTRECALRLIHQRRRLWNYLERDIYLTVCALLQTCAPKITFLSHKAAAIFQQILKQMRLAQKLDVNLSRNNGQGINLPGEAYWRVNRSFSITSRSVSFPFPIRNHVCSGRARPQMSRNTPPLSSNK